MEKRLSDVCEITMGQAPVGASYNFDSKGLPLLAGAGDFGDVFPSPSKFTTSPGKISKTGDIIVCIRATIGDLNWSDKEYCLGRGVAGLRPKNDELDKQYLWNWLRASKDKLEKNAKGSTFKQISRDDIASLQIPLPSIDKQKRIAGMLDKADAICRKRAESLKLLDELLRATFFDMFGDPITNPKRWPVRQLADVVRAGSIVTYGIVQAGPNYPGGVPYIRTGDIKRSKILEHQLMCTDPEIASKFKRSEVQTGDLVMSIRATVGTVAMVPPSLSGANLTQGTAKISPGPDVDGRFLFSYISSEGCQDWIQRHVKGATFREITLSKLREMPVYVPDKNSQRKFREIADQYEKAKNDYAHFAKESDTLFHALVARAFKGEL